MFAGLLAGRYIRAQKRHSVLTICSIAVALALMTMLFTSYSTLFGCFRSIIYDREGAYHIVIPDITKEQGFALSKAVGDDGSCKVKQTGQDTYTALILFDSYIGDRESYISELLQKARLPQSTYYGENTALMMLDMIDLNARYLMAQYFALFYVFVIFIAIALRLVIDTAFEVSSKERERQFGVLQSIGATPSQIVSIITCEGLFLSVIGIPVGMAAGIGLAFAAYKAVLGSGLSEAYFTPEKAAELLHFHVNPWLTLAAALTGLVWVMLSAYGTGMRIIRMSPIQAISARSNTVKKVRRRSVFGMLFGWKGKLAARNNRRQPKRFVITVVSLTLSITLFASFGVVMERAEKVFLEPYEDDYYMSVDFDINFSSESGTFANYDPFSFCEPLQEIRDCGYFTDIAYDIGKVGAYLPEDGDNNVTIVRYVCEESYDRLFEGNPPVSYAELSAQRGYILLTDNNKCPPERFAGMSSIPLQFEKHTNLTVEEYEALSPEQQEKAEAYTYYDGETDTSTVLYYDLGVKEITDFPITCTAEDIEYYEGWTGNPVFLISTTDAFLNGEHERYGSGYISSVISCNLVDEEQYREAVQFLKQSPSLYLMNDFFGQRRQIRATFAAVRIGVGFLNLMIALIAVVNMVNILSTGILNRRRETAAMQCIGLTEGQLYGMTAVECLQYALGAGAAALALCGALVIGTEMMLNAMTMTELEDMVSYAALLPRIGIAALAAFLAALLASLIPLRGMQKTPLAEQLRSVD